MTIFSWIKTPYPDPLFHLSLPIKNKNEISEDKTNLNKIFNQNIKIF